MRLLFLLMLSAMSTMAFAPATPAGQLQGAWSSNTNVDGTQVKQVLLFSNGFFSWTSYKAESGEFVQTKGGSFALNGDKLALHFEFSTADTTEVGTTETWTLASKEKSLQLTDKNGKQFKGEALDNGVRTPLTGAWLMAGRKQDDKISRRDTTTPRKTMKILTGNRFQWIAYNIETKQFSGTGGGTYTAENGKYTENIEFFSRDNKRVGMKLEFNFDVQDSDWHHMGKSSAGEPMYEIWAKRDK